MWEPNFTPHSPGRERLDPLAMPDAPLDMNGTGPAGAAGLLLGTAHGAPPLPLAAGAPTAPTSIESVAALMGCTGGLLGVVAYIMPLLLQTARNMMHDLGEMDPDQFFERCWQPMVLYVVFMAFWTPAVQLLTSIFPAGPWRRVAVDAQSTLGRRVGWATLQMVSLMAALLALILLHAVGYRALLAVQAGARTLPAIAAPPNSTPYDLQLQQLQWSQQGQEVQIQAMWEAFSRATEHRPTPPTGATHAEPGAHSPPTATPHAEPGTHSPPAATSHAEPAADTRSAPSTGRTTTRRAAEAAPTATRGALPPGGCLVPATFNSYTALHAQHCVSTHLLSTQSAYSNTLAAARSLGSLFDERHGAGASISRIELLRGGDGLLPTFFGEWWDPSLGTLLVEAPRL